MMRAAFPYSAANHGVSHWPMERIQRGEYVLHNDGWLWLAWYCSVQSQVKEMLHPQVLVPPRTVSPSPLL